nr:MAG TPA: baseplate protein [Caudoviricetes sp.]
MKLDDIGLKKVFELMKGRIWKECYPVGSIYMSVNSTDPSTLFGGSWERIQDTFLLASGNSYGAGSTGGSANAAVVRHTHVAQEHTHIQNPHTHGTNLGDNIGFATYTHDSGVERMKVASSSSSKRYTFASKPSGSNSAAASGLNWSSGLSEARPYIGSETVQINNTGVDGAGKNMPPYLAVYVWKRTA